MLRAETMEERVRALIVENFPSILSNLGNTDLLRDKGFTSLMFVELILLLEREFSIEVLDEEIGPGRFSTVKRIADYVQCKLDGRAMPPLPVCEERGLHRCGKTSGVEK
jgi:acyl carrier protein